MRVLMILPYTPTLVRTRSFNFLKGLVQAGVEVTLATVWENDEEREQLSSWTAQGVDVISAQLTRLDKLGNLAFALPTRLPLQARYCWQPRLASQIGEVLGRRAYDIVHIEHLRGAEYGLYAKAILQLRNVRLPMVWDSVDCISLLFEQAAVTSRSIFGRWITRFELGRTKRYERRMVGTFAQTLVTSQSDREALVTMAGQERIQECVTVLKNGVDLEYFSKSDLPKAKDLVIFSGKMSYHANLHAAMVLVKEIMPIVWMKKPHIRVQLVGKDPPYELRKLALDDSRVEVTGTVPNLAVYLQNATIAVAPVMYGVGIQNKILEAMACGTPVITSRQGVSALDTVAGRDLLTAGTAEEFARKIIETLDNAALLAELGENGRLFVEKHHQWKDIIKELLKIYGRGRNSQPSSRA